MTKTVKHMSFSKGACLKTTNKVPAASLKRRKHGLGLPIHIKKVSLLLNIRYYIILVLNSLLYIHYIEFPIRIRDFPVWHNQFFSNIDTYSQNMDNKLVKMTKHMSFSKGACLNKNKKNACGKPETP